MSQRRKLICLAISTLAFTVNHARCQAFDRTTASEQFTSLSTPHPIEAPGNTVISQSFPIPGVSSPPQLPSALIRIPGITPIEEIWEDINPGGSTPAPEPEPGLEPLPPPYGDSGSYEAMPPLRPFSLKDVRQSVNIALPTEAEIPLLTELPFDKMHPGVVGQADFAVDGRRVDFYQFKGEENQQIVVVLRNSDDNRQDGLPLSPYVMVFDPTGEVMAGTIIPGQHRIPTTDPLLPLDNQLALRLPQSGHYVVAVFTDPGAVGRYGIGWKQDETRYRYDELHELTDVESSTPAEITGRTGQVIQIRAISYQFDPVVKLIDANGNVVAEDDDDGGNYNARIDITLPADGVYRAIVSSADGHGRGQYRLRMR